MLAGIDISHWQNDIKWGEVKRSGVKFAFIHATEFSTRSTQLSVSPKLMSNIYAAQAHDIHWSAYHHFCTHIDPIIQAEAYLRSVGTCGSLPPSVKLAQAGIKAERLNYKLRLFLEKIEKNLNRKAIICTSRVFWQTYMTAEQEAITDWAREYPLWLIQFNAMWPTPMYPWAGWGFWQYTDDGRLPGIRTDVKMNWFNGGEEDLVKQFLDYEQEGVSDMATSESNNPTQPQLDKYAEDKQNKDPDTLVGKVEDPHEHLKDDFPSHLPKDGNWVDSYFFHNQD